MTIRCGDPYRKQLKDEEEQGRKKPQCLPSFTKSLPVSTLHTWHGTDRATYALVAIMSLGNFQIITVRLYSSSTSFFSETPHDKNVKVATIKSKLEDEQKDANGSTASGHHSLWVFTVIFINYWSDQFKLDHFQAQLWDDKNEDA